MIRGASAVIRLTFPSKRETEIIGVSIKPETEVASKYRSRVKISRDGGSIIMLFESKDITALRASINSYLSWLMSLREIYSLLESQEKSV
ncbi:MAG: KEOPS complex subunit Pcc1 [Candidatus Bathyarchaeia archaeon]